MPRSSNSIGWAGALLINLALASVRPAGSVAQALKDSPTITNLAQLTYALSLEERLYCSLRLEVLVCASSKPNMGLLVVQDATGVELLELGRRAEALAPGERIRFEGERLLLRRRELGTQISAAPVVDNDGLHGWRMHTNVVMLKAGRLPLKLEWFNCLRNFGLDVFCQESEGPSLVLAVPALWHAGKTVAASRENAASLVADKSGALTRRRYNEALEPGLQAEAYEGHWEKVPDFDLLTPVKSGTTTNCDVGFRTRDELVGLRFTGFFEAPRDGKYTFRVGSDDGTLLFIGRTEIPVQRLGATNLAQCQPGVIGERMNSLEERRWLCIQGRVGFISRQGGALQLELRSGVDTLSVTVVDAEGLEPAALRNTSVRVVGVGRAAMSADQRVVLDRLIVPDGRELTCVDAKEERRGMPVPLLGNISQVQAMPLEEAKRQVPVRICGVVTASNPSDHWVSLEDDTRGIFVDVSRMSNGLSHPGQMCEVVGHTAPGNFAPIVVAEWMQRWGPGRMPEPARPTWNELANGSMDVQWVQFQGLVSGVQSNRLNLLLPEGSLEVEMENYFEPELKNYRQALVHIRGTLFAIWNANTREVRFGRLLMRNASISIDAPPLTDVFAAPAKTVRDLLLFDPHANALRPVKVRVKVLFADSQNVFAIDNGMGLRVLTAEAEALSPGDLIEAVGYPEIGGPSPLLRQALVRKTGTTPLPLPKVLAGLALTRKGLDATRVVVDAKLIGVHKEQRSSVLELQSEGQLFMARLKHKANAPLSLRTGSQLRVSGVYAEMGKSGLGTQVGGFELLLNSAADIQVLSQPSWWTLGRLGTVVGVLLVGLVLAAVWITQLRRQVEQRTVQLQREIRERERIEHHRELEAERSRIARDLHDDLGSSLTEIGALASTGQRAGTDAQGSPSLFEAIAGKARGSIAALDVIVWAVDPEDNSLQSLADYLSGFASEYLAHARLSCRFKIPVRFPSVMLEGKVRHDLFLAVKETLNNIVRHSRASEVEFGMSVTESTLEILVADNGTGFDASAPSNGNGSKNLRERLTKVGGSCVVDSHSGGGTRVRICVPLDISPVSSRGRAGAHTTFD